MTPILRTLAGLVGGSLIGHLLNLVSRLRGAHGDTQARKLHTRRSFTRNAALGSVGIVSLGGVASFIALLWPNETGAFGGEITIPASSIPEPHGEPFRYPQGQFYLVHTDHGLEALWWKCVHLGCTVPWIEGQEQFICPCHGSVYEYNGSRVSGPAPRALDAFPITVDAEGNAIVNTNPATIIVRDEYQPAHATPYNA